MKRTLTFTAEDVASMFTAANLNGEEVSCWDEDEHWGDTTVKAVEASGHGRVIVTLENGQVFEAIIREWLGPSVRPSNDNTPNAVVAAA